MNLDKIIQELELTLLTEPRDFAEVVPTGGYVSDLLSCVMAGAVRNGVWITLQSHVNIIAVAALLDLSAIIVTEGATPDQATIQRANQEGVVLLLSSRPSFFIAGKLWEMGLRAEQP
jgi:hypothetical protein